MSKMEETIATCTNLDTLAWWEEHFQGLLHRVRERIVEVEQAVGDAQGESDLKPQLG